MGEIKSTLDLAMERAEKIKVSPEDKEKLNREKYLSKAKGIANRYLKGSLNINGLIKELDSLDANERDMVIEPLVSQLVDAMGISVDNKSPLRAIEMMTQGGVKDTSDRIHALRSFSGHRCRGGQCSAGHGHDDAAAHHDLSAVQIDALRPGGRLASDCRLPCQKFPVAGADPLMVPPVRRMPTR